MKKPNSRVSRRSMLMMSATTLAASAGFVPAHAQPSYPSKPVRIVCAFPPGNASDIVARILGDQLSKRWGQPVVVENRPGASGIIAATAVQQAPADGYTLLMTSTSFIVNASVMKNVPYDVKKDFTGVSLINSVPVILLVSNRFPAKTMAQWVEEVKRHPGKYTYAHPGVGTIHNLTTKLLLQKTGTDVVEVPYKGSMQALTDIIGGSGDMMFEAANSAYTFVETGKVRALATSGPARYYALPDVPTLKESGVDISAVGFTALIAPAGTPRQIVDFLNGEVQIALKRPEVQETLKKSAMELYPPMDAQSVQAWLANESDRWAQVASMAKIPKE
ncbi:tripartite tricarboxylate transporter substrate binding protein [Pigmentiphaga sp. H8]|uniref:Bug family tripartite tricarboxylate transporter substrate binding protein n=1 Tax=Pigmentiphaga sp. H8 TaxID=2488560 RepID=UPI000F5B2F1A|nr:tripartite tricarboxylate transporter substrate binding protein [Pigmentiphaga sp. H8]AZG11159.1 tripartite tricarboxylate transporter substrate binding protein [Pigmentiphaga sp. H8]